MTDELIQIEGQAPKDGTKHAGFVHGGENKPPRQCGNCVWMGMASCGHPEIVADPELHTNDLNRVPVDEDDCSDYFQSRGNALIYIMRHGSTKFNQENAFRGWINVPLDEKGKKQAMLTREFLADKGIKSVYTSDLGRAVETAKLALPAKKAEKDSNLKPWDMGVFSGKPKESHQGIVNWFIDNPAISIPEGESLQDFADRMNKAWKKYLKLAQEEGPILLVFHSSNSIQFEKQAEGKDELGRPEDTELVPPGGVMVILGEKSEAGMVYKAEVIFGETQAASYGS